MKDVVEKEMARRIPAYERVGLRVAPSRVGPDAALKGAAALVLAQFFTQFDHVKDDPLPTGW